MCMYEEFIIQMWLESRMTWETMRVAIRGGAVVKRGNTSLWVLL